MNEMALDSHEQNNLMRDSVFIFASSMKYLVADTKDELLDEKQGL